MPGCFMAAVRHNRPSILIYGGTIQPGVRHVDCPEMGLKKGGTVNISDAFESFGPFKSYTVYMILMGQERCFLCWQDQRRATI